MHVMEEKDHFKISDVVIKKKKLPFVDYKNAFTKPISKITEWIFGPKALNLLILLFAVYGLINVYQPECNNTNYGEHHYMRFSENNLCWKCDVCYTQLDVFYNSYFKGLCDAFIWKLFDFA